LELDWLPNRGGNDPKNAGSKHGNNGKNRRRNNNAQRKRQYESHRGLPPKDGAIRCHMKQAPGAFQTAGANSAWCSSNMPAWSRRAQVQILPR